MRMHQQGRKRLAKLLLIQEVTHRQVAEAVGWRSHGMLGHLLSGRRTGVDPAHALALCKFLGVEVSDLFLTEIPTHRSQRSRAGAA
jgi:transcriptional regulator with XRE-family HTH domain